MASYNITKQIPHVLSTQRLSLSSLTIDFACVCKGRIKYISTRTHTHKEREEGWIKLHQE